MPDPLKMAKIQNSHWATQISQSYGPISVQFSMKVMGYLGFFWVQMGPGSKIKRSQLRLAALFQNPLIKGLLLVKQFRS